MIAAETITRSQIRSVGIKAFERGDMGLFDATVIALSWDDSEAVRKARKTCADAMNGGAL